MKFFEWAPRKVGLTFGVRASPGSGPEARFLAFASPGSGPEVRLVAFAPPIRIRIRIRKRIRIRIRIRKMIRIRIKIRIRIRIRIDRSSVTIVAQGRSQIPKSPLISFVPSLRALAKLCLGVG